MRRAVGAVDWTGRARLRFLGGDGDRPAWWGHELEAGLLREIGRGRVGQASSLGSASLFPPVRLGIAHAALASELCGVFLLANCSGDCFTVLWWAVLAF